MPIYEYACMECEDHFDELVRSDDQVITCPSCNATDVLKQISAFAVHGAAAKPSFGGSGGGCCGGGRGFLWAPPVGKGRGGGVGAGAAARGLLPPAPNRRSHRGRL